MIPKVIHYCWFGNNPLPFEVKKCINSWKKICPDYEIRRWDETNFDVYQNDFIKSAYGSKAWAFVSDYARLKIVYDEGGIYLDTDVELKKSLDELRKNEGFFAIQQEGHYCNTGLGFGAKKENEIVKTMLDLYDDLIYSEENKFSIACPYLNTKALEKYGYSYSDDVIVIHNNLVLPPRFMDPIAPGKNKENLLCNDTVSIHHYSASWMDDKTVRRRKIIRIIGEKRIYKIKKILKGVNNE
ncbi:glycosyl transferase [Holdemanella porci]|uniref:glycosyltransferase family 32 protein n=1 Tax=Holdemanella porci TaxID=2652276 RepID=UPI001D151A71|nr:glycosyltransferase [Holdemanella porci]MCC3360514.1 glycosyl transferase [Holdemanella porci]